MNNFNKVFVAFLLGLLVQLAASNAMAVPTAGRVQSQSVPYIFSLEYILAKDVGYTIRVNAVSPVDPVLHVQERTSGIFLAGNDDYNGTSSSVTIPAVGTARNVWIVVRAYNSYFEGIATFEIDPTVGATVSYPINVKAGFVHDKRRPNEPNDPPLTYQSGSHFFSVEEQGGSNNTIILALSGNAATAIAYDDNDGVGLMSWLHTPTACSSSCKVIVGSRSLSAGTATYMWDEDIHYTDSDGDGASNVLEAALTTDPYAVDTDADGLEDMAETMGVDTADGLLRLPYYGADPKRADVFVQADWLECIPTISDPGKCGQPPNPDLYQFTTASATVLREKYFDPDFLGQPNNLIYTHVDNGMTNIDPATRTESGLWDGATRHTTKTTDKCEWGDATRDGYFHFARMFPGAGQAYQDGVCLDASNAADGGVAAHELGHNIGLHHTAKQSGTTEMNCKPNYRSLMSYAISYGDHKFSSGEFINRPLNPTEMNEATGLGTTDGALLEHLDSTFGGHFKFLTRKNKDGTYTGAIDWNRDGDWAPGVVRAAPTWAYKGCSAGAYQADNGCSASGDNCKGVWQGRVGSALAWLPTTSGDRLYWFTRNAATNQIEYRYATDFPESCGTPPQADCKTTWVPALTQSAVVLSSSVASAPPAVARYWDTSNLVYKLLLVYPDSNDLLHSRIFTPTGHGYWSTPVFMPGGIAIQGDVAAATYEDRAYVYASAASGSKLYKWSLSNGGAWTGPATQYWAGTGAEVQTPFGIGATSGQYRPGGGSPVTRMFAAIPLVTPLGKLVFAWNNASTSNTWTAFPDTDWGINTQYAKAQPGLAYAPFDPTAPTGPGRFYLAWTPPDGGSPPTPQPMLLAMTKGNEQLTGIAPRQLRWDPIPTYLDGDWSYGTANNTLHYDLSFDDNVRAAFTREYQPICEQNTDCPMGGVCTNKLCTAYQALTFGPFGDGIFDNVIGDQDDYPVLKYNLDACFGAHAFY